MKKLIFGLVFFSLFLLGCQQAAQESGVIKLGSILPLTGDAAAIGQNTRAAIELAVEEINAEGGINGRDVEVIFEDGKCGPKDAASAANKLINIDGVPVILGGLCSSETLAVAPIAEGNTVLFSMCSSSPDVTDAGDYVFRDYPSDAFAGVRGAEVAFDDLNARDAAILYCLSDWCVGVKGVFQESFSDKGGAIVANEAYEQADRDLRTQLAKIKDTDPDVVYFVGYTEASIAGLKQAKELGIDAKMLGADAWDDPTIIREAGEAAEGIMWVNPAAAVPDDFKEKMAAKTGSDEVTICSPQGYDATHIIAEIMGRVGTSAEAIKDELYNVDGYEGVSGVITLDENGDLATANYEVKRVEDGKAMIVG